MASKTGSRVGVGDPLDDDSESVLLNLRLHDTDLSGLTDGSLGGQPASVAMANRLVIYCRVV